MRWVACQVIDRPLLSLLLAACTVDLHYLSVMDARTFLRAWLLFLRRSALAGVRLPDGATLRIITGWGRNSRGNVPRLKPQVAALLQGELGPQPLAISEPAFNSGIYCVAAVE